MKIFVIECIHKMNGVAYKSMISSEGYTSVERAREFIGTRLPKPELVDSMNFTTPNYDYKIHEINVVS